MFEQTVARALARLGVDQQGANPHPRQPAPMLLQKAEAMFSSRDWTYKPKWDGFRVLASVRAGSVQLTTCGGKYTHEPPRATFSTGCAEGGQITQVEAARRLHVSRATIFRLLRERGSKSQGGSLEHM
jgi:ATP-dependent DNA ligase